MNIQDYKSGFHIGMHGLGMVYGIPHSNSQEALEYWKAKGINFFEVDIAITDDDEYILLAHDVNRKDLKKIEVLEKPIDGKYTIEWINNIRSCKLSSKIGFRIITLEEFIRIVASDSRMIAMVDTYGRNENDIINIVSIIEKNVGNNPEVMDRVLVETYSLDDSRKILSLFQHVHIIACIREDGYKFWTNDINLELLGGIDFISCKWKYIREEKKIIEFCKANNIGILSLSRFDNNRRKKIRMGVNINLVDVYGNSNVLIYCKNMFDYLLHFLRIMKEQ